MEIILHLLISASWKYIAVTSVNHIFIYFLTNFTLLLFVVHKA